MPFHAHKPARGACRQCESAIELTTLISSTSEMLPAIPISHTYYFCQSFRTHDRVAEPLFWERWVTGADLGREG